MHLLYYKVYSIKLIHKLFQTDELKVYFKLLNAFKAIHKEKKIEFVELNLLVIFNYTTITFFCADCDKNFFLGSFYLIDYTTQMWLLVQRRKQKKKKSVNKVDRTTLMS